MHPLRKSLKPPKERGKKVDSTLLDVKASTLQHVGQPYTVGRAGSTRNKETTEASVRKRFELAYAENLLNFLQFFFFLLTFFLFTFSLISFLFFAYFNFVSFLALFALYIPIKFILRCQQGVEHCSSRDIVATVNESVRVVE